MAVNKLERLMNLTAALLATERPLSREELHTRVPGYPEETSSYRRAFERDKNELRQMAVPLSVEPVPGTDPPVEGYRIPPDEYYLRDPGLEADELAALGFDWFRPGDIDGLAAEIESPDVARLSHNRDLARQWFSFDRIRRQLADLLTERGWLP